MAKQCATVVDNQGNIDSVILKNYDNITPLERAVKRNKGYSLDKASNGEPSLLYQFYTDEMNMSPEEAEFVVANTFSTEFGDWFGRWWEDGADASKVVDINGQPKPVWSGQLAHSKFDGTYKGYEENYIEDGYERFSRSAFFLEDKYDALSYATALSIRDEKTLKMYQKFLPQGYHHEPVFLNIKNIKKIDSIGYETIMPLIPESKEKGIDGFEGKTTSAFGTQVNSWVISSGSQVIPLSEKEDLSDQMGVQFQNSASIKPSVSEIFQENPELSPIGTEEEYSEYLDTIFPDSKVKDIVYHGTDKIFEEFSKDAEKATISDQGIFFAPTKNQARNSGKIIVKAVINSNPLISDNRIERISEKKKQELISQGYNGYVYSYNKIISSADDIVVFEPEQIHILGSKQDIEGFKDWKSNKSNLQEERRNAEKDGTWMKAPNGENSNLTEEQWLYVRTEEFKDFFGDWETDVENSSKIVDENGEPQVVYHGTNKEFETFEGVKIQGKELSFFSTDLEYAQAHSMKNENGEKSIVKEVFLNIRNPIEKNDINTLTVVKDIKADPSMKNDGFIGRDKVTDKNVIVTTNVDQIRSFSEVQTKLEPFMTKEQALDIGKTNNNKYEFSKEELEFIDEIKSATSKMKEEGYENERQDEQVFKEWNTGIFTNDELYLSIRMKGNEKYDDFLYSYLVSLNPEFSDINVEKTNSDSSSPFTLKRDLISGVGSSTTYHDMKFFIEDLQGTMVNADSDYYDYKKEIEEKYNKNFGFGISPENLYIYDQKEGKPTPEDFEISQNTADNLRTIFEKNNEIEVQQNEFIPSQLFEELSQQPFMTKEQALDIYQHIYTEGLNEWKDNDMTC